jgi:UDP-N-acetylglucosamine diphosphorylase/glucosamine-1-phosphate N-acetyltransferase
MTPQAASRGDGADGPAAKDPLMATFVCVFEDKKFSNFFPLSLSQPVFELRIGFHSLRLRLEQEIDADKRGALCRDYLAPALRLRDPEIVVNDVPSGSAVFVNGRLLCYGDELRELLDRLPDGAIAVKGGYVVAARLSGKAAEEFAAYVRRRISDETIGQLCDELSGYVTRTAKAGSGKQRKRTILSQEAGEGTYEDDHAVGQDSLAEKLPKQLLDLIDQHGLKRLEVSDARLLSFPWQIIEENPRAIEDDFQKSPFRGQSEEAVVYPGARMVGEENILVGEGVVVKPGVVLDASSGPIVINDGATVMANAVVLGPAYIGRNSVVKAGAKILEGTSIGDVCKVGGEVGNTVFGNYSNKQHDGFVGHSYIGEWVNIGAGANNSDLKNNYSAVRMWCAGMVRETGRQFLGFIMGDHTKVGIGATFNSGTVVGFNCNIYGSEAPNRFVPSFSWGRGAEMSDYVLEKAMLTAQVVMERRDVKFTDAHQQVFQRIFDLSGRCARNV